MQIIIYCLTYQPSVTLSQRSILNLSSRFSLSEVDDLLDKHLAKIAKREYGSRMMYSPESVQQVGIATWRCANHGHISVPQFSF